jgi:hypothetical protein
MTWAVLSAVQVEEPESNCTENAWLRYCVLGHISTAKQQLVQRRL